MTDFVEPRQSQFYASPPSTAGKIANANIERYFANLGKRTFPHDPDRAALFAECVKHIFVPMLEKQDGKTTEQPLELDIVDRVRKARMKRQMHGAWKDAANEITYDMRKLEARIAHLFEAKSVYANISRMDVVLSWVADAVQRDDLWLYQRGSDGTFYEFRRIKGKPLAFYNKALSEHADFRMRGLIKDYDYTLNDARLKRLPEQRMQRFVRLLTPRALRRVGSDLKNCLQHTDPKKRVLHIDYDKQMRTSSADFYALCENETGKVRACLQVEGAAPWGLRQVMKASDKTIMTEAGEHAPGYINYYANEVLNFVHHNQLQMGKQHHRTGFAEVRRGYVPVHELRKSDVVDGDLNLTSYRGPLEGLDGVKVRGTLDLTSVGLECIPAVEAHRIIARRCEGLCRIQPDAKASYLETDALLFQSPARMEIKQVRFYDNSDPWNTQPVLLSWPEYRSFVQEARARRWNAAALYGYLVEKGVGQRRPVVPGASNAGSITGYYL